MDIDLEDFNSRKTRIFISNIIGEIYEINELYNTSKPKLINIANQIKEASAKAMRDCIEKVNQDFSIFGEIELKAIKNEERDRKNQKKYAKNITKSILQTNHGYWPRLNDSNRIRVNKADEKMLTFPKTLHHIIKDEQYKQSIRSVIIKNTIYD